MAKIGVLHPCFAPFAGEEPASGAPTYGTGLVLGKAVTANLSPNIAEGEMYADNMNAESAREFISGDISLETDRLDDKTAATIYGATITEEGELTDNVEDTAPYGGLGYVQRLKRGGKTYYRGRFYPKAMATIGADNSQTKGESITFVPESTSFRIMSPNNGNWRVTQTFESEDAAIEWLHTKLNIAETGA